MFPRNGIKEKRLKNRVLTTPVFIIVIFIVIFEIDIYL